MINIPRIPCYLETLAAIDRVLAQTGSDKSKLLRVEIWLSDMAEFDAMNSVYEIISTKMIIL